MISLHIGGVCRHHLLQLYDGQVLPVLPGIIQALVKPLHCLVDGLQLPGDFLYFADIIVGDIVVGLDVLAQDPLHQRLDHVSPAVIHKPQKVPGRDVGLVVLETFTERFDRAGQIPDLRLLQSVIVPVVGLVHQFRRILHK